MKNSPDKLSIFIGLPLSALSVVYLFALASLLWDIPRLSLRFQGYPLAPDFANYWCAARLTLAGKAALAFNIFELHGLQQSIFGVHHYYGCGWYYPPTFLLIVIPLAFFPYLAALAIWALLTYSGYVLTLRSLEPHPFILWMGLTFPGALINILFGQNGLLSASLLGGALLLLEPAPIWGGVLIGLLSYKPNLAILAFFALAVGRNWRALVAAVVGALAFALLSLFAFGTEPWLAYIHNFSIPMHLLEMGAADWSIIPTFFSAVLSLGYGIVTAYVAQGLVALVSVCAVAYAWSKGTSLPIRGSILILATLLFTPYLFVYDLALLAFPLAWLWLDGCDRGWLWGERPILLLGWMVPLGSQIIWNLRIIDQAKLQVGPVIILGCFVLALIRLKKYYLKERILPIA
jgi:hypothetical protein